MTTLSPDGSHYWTGHAWLPVPTVPGWDPSVRVPRTLTAWAPIAIPAILGGLAVSFVGSFAATWLWLDIFNHQLRATFGG